MKKALLAATASLLFASSANAVSISLFEVGVNKDGDQPTPANVKYALDDSGLGSVSVIVKGKGEHFVLGYFDYEIGDLFFFAEGESKRSITHVGMSLGGWRMIHSSRGRNGVYVDDLQERKSLMDIFVGTGSFLR